MVDFNERTKLAIEMVKRAGAEALEIQKGDVGARDKGVNDVVTAADMASEKIITDSIISNFGDDGIIAEEGSRKESRTGYVWVADPLDGTINYSRGMPLWAVSVGYMKDGAAQGGAMYIPRLDELFVCERGKGAWLNGERISVSDRDLKCAIGSIDFGSRIQLREQFENVNKKLMENNMHIRKLGTAVTALCYVACGRLELFCSLMCNLWDIMPASLLVEEAGGKITQLNGSEVDYTQVEKHCVIGTNGIIHERTLELVVERKD